MAQGSSPDDYYERYYYTYPVWRCSSQKDTSPTNDGPFMGKADPDVAWHPTYMGEGDTKCPSHLCTNGSQAEFHGNAVRHQA